MKDRIFLRDFCQQLQAFYHSKDYALVINMPPLHGKSRTAQRFTQWLLGIDPKIKIITGSYNEMLSTAFSKSVRDAISQKPVPGGQVVYQDIFPYTRIKKGDAAAGLWSLEGQHANYLATSPGGTATGFGCNILIVDDIIRNAAEAYNRIQLDKLWEWFSNTMLSRLEEGGKIIIIMTRWSTMDLAGRAIEHFGATGRKYRLVTFPAENEAGEMLCPEILSKESYLMRQDDMGRDIVAANYQQQPIDIKGRLYSGFATYDQLPQDSFGNPLWEEVVCYTDTADCGKDFLCAIIYGRYQGQAYVLDILYSQQPMEVTEPALAAMLLRHRVTRARIESNNGGRGFARNIERILQERYHTNSVVVQWFHQSGNKEARILSHASWVQQHVLFPAQWQRQFCEFARDLLDYQRQGENLHDDAPDALTGVAETILDRGDAVAAFNRFELGL